MQDSATRPPVTTLRITRPYASEEELLRGDLAFFGRSSIVLAGAPVRPEGALVRFEIVLSTGAAALRGEGTVLAHHGPASGRPPGLELKLTRLDARSKALLDQARALRAQAGRPADSLVPRLASLAPASLAPASAAASQAPAAPATARSPQIPARVGGTSSAPPAHASRPAPAPSRPPPPPARASEPLPASPEVPVDRTTETSGVRPSIPGRGPVPTFTRPPNRDEILARLRERAARLDGARPFGKRPVSE